MMKQLLKFNYALLVVGLFAFTACQDEDIPEINSTDEAIIELRDDGSFDVLDGDNDNRPEWWNKLKGRRPGFGRLNMCFELIFPVTLEFPDGTSQEVESDEALRTALKDWKTNNDTGVGGRPQIAFPFDVELSDGDTLTIDERSDFREIAQDCNQGRPHYKGRFKRCYRLVYPVTISYPDETTADAADREALRELLRAWRTDNPDATEHPTLVYPLDIQLADSTIVTVGSREEIGEVTADCRINRPHFWRNRCFVLQFPVMVEFADERTVEILDVNELFTVYKNWLEDYPRGDHPEIIFPFDVKLRSDDSVVTVNSIADLEDLQETCRTE